MAAKQTSAALRLPLLAAVGGVLAVDSALKSANRRAAKRLCAERTARIASAKDRFVARVGAMAASGAWDEGEYAKAVEEFSAARDAEMGTWNSRRALSAHLRARAKRESAWKLWIDEFAGEAMQLLGIYSVYSDYKTPSREILDRGLSSIRESLDLRGRLRNGSLGRGELERLLRLPPAPGERRRPRKGAPIRKLCSASLQPPPDGETLLKSWEETRGHGKIKEKIRLGSMLLDAEATVDSSLVRDKDGEIVGRKPGLKGWLETNCPRLLPHYGTLMRLRRLAAAFREEHGIADPVPATTLITEEERAPAQWKERIARARSEAAKLLAGAEAKSVAALSAELLRRKERREEIARATREAMMAAVRKRQGRDGMTA